MSVCPFHDCSDHVWQVRNHFSMWIQWCRFHDQSDHIWQVQQTHKCDTSSGTIFGCEFNGDVGFMIRVTMYSKSGKHTSVIHFQEPFSNVNSTVMSISWSEWSYMVSPASTQVWYIFRNHFSTWIQWWCQFRDPSDHIWQVRQTHKCDTFSGTIFRREFNGDVSFVIRVTIYGKSGKHTSVIHFQEPFFDVNSTVMSVSWSEWPYMASPANTQV